MSTMQIVFDRVSDSWRRERSRRHLTLGALIGVLERAHPRLPVAMSGGDWAPARPHSYRGYYSDLAFAATHDSVTAGELCALCCWCLGRTFVGYKGGDFVMGEDTPLWCAEYGNTGLAIVDAVAEDGRLLLKTKSVD